MNSDLIPLLLPEWETDGPLGEGASSTVYKAHRRGHPEDTAAIKVISVSYDRAWSLPPEEENRYYDQQTARCVNEARTMELLGQHRNIVSIREWKLHERRPFGIDILIRMELLTPLSDFIRNERLTERDVLKLGEDLCRALSACEARRLIHRDIKPENILVDLSSGEPVYKLADFGASMTMRDHMSKVSFNGTPRYIAPEVFFSRPFDHRADIYSLGMTLYVLLNRGRMPFLNPGQLLYTEEQRNAAISRRINGEALPPPADASEPAAAVILKACAFQPEKRYSSAEAFLSALRAVSSGTAKLPQRKHRWKLLAAAAALLVAAGVYLLLRPDPSLPRVTITGRAASVSVQVDQITTDRVRLRMETSDEVESVMMRNRWSETAFMTTLADTAGGRKTWQVTMLWNPTDDMCDDFIYLMRKGDWELTGTRVTVLWPGQAAEEE